MATIRAPGSFVPFLLPLQDDGFVRVSEDLLSLRFNLQLRTMYLEQEMYSGDGEVYETILVQKTRTEDGSVWILGPGSFRVIGLSESQMQASTVILTNESGTSTVQIPTVATVKLEPNDDSVLVLSDSEFVLLLIFQTYRHIHFKVKTPLLHNFPNPHLVLCATHWFTI
jgi:hypothetical protein